MKKLILYITLFLIACSSPTSEVEFNEGESFMIGYVSDTNLDRNPIMFTNQNRTIFLHDYEFDIHRARQDRMVIVRWDGEKYIGLRTEKYY